MVVLLFRLLILIAVIFLIYTAYKYWTSPRRKLDIATTNKVFYFHDDIQNTKHNFLVTYKGHVFEGEKYLGTTEKAFEVVNINVSAKNPNTIRGLEREDMYFLEKEILIRYPHAEIEWKYPLNRLLIQNVVDERKDPPF
ncbi:sigma-w pathway protein ysdB [Thalassobacillus pellis]|uniref:sigma-w pathway protein ysdB n=1 Tax=Thalassobacillus pellis TaxID=748008 RepID=UPI0019612FF1|nr:sigma-w pathway protein ysdB [Thalassobacillus pellis]MBM7555010.1 cbb3-type cytochrome oxidase subunit 3 [Thalassobacillus pellis]